jgi:sarcosine oxidase
VVGRGGMEFPAFALPPDWAVVVQDGGAILKADVALRIMRLRAGACSGGSPD